MTVSKSFGAISRIYVRVSRVNGYVQVVADFEVALYDHVSRNEKLEIGTLTTSLVGTADGGMSMWHFKATGS